MITGKLGEDLDVTAGAAAARACAISLLAQVKVALGGDLEQARGIHARIDLCRGEEAR